ncbi:VOC family protein [Hydrogenophaga sp. 5NK40-0174]|uniref:VOC family protein n=1 Tax=Hydrogenophaga sp. 5NK40-0174 TaxID=3127649 RepID=UPI00310C59BC
MQLGYTILYVPDVPRAVAFYEAAFGLELAFMHPSCDFATLKTGDTALSFCSRQLLQAQGKLPSAPDADRPCFEIALTTHDVAGALDRAVRAGATLKQSPELMSWGQTVAFVADPDGFWVELCTPVEPSDSA